MSQTRLPLFGRLQLTEPRLTLIELAAALAEGCAA
jgi:hypothetical protein